MCGRFYIADESRDAEIKKILDKIDMQQREKMKSGEIFPTNHAPIIRDEDRVDLLQWGFPKFNAKGVIINARSETASQKSMFSKSLRERRCVIPCSGFYEWQKKDASKPKSKFLFTSNESTIMYFAGLWNEYKGEDEGRFVILTRDANISIADIHDRMPVVLYGTEISSWLNDDKFVDYAFRREDVVLHREEVV